MCGVVSWSADSEMRRDTATEPSGKQRGLRAGQQVLDVEYFRSRIEGLIKITIGQPSLQIICPDPLGLPASCTDTYCNFQTMCLLVYFIGKFLYFYTAPIAAHNDQYV